MRAAVLATVALLLAACGGVAASGPTTGAGPMRDTANPSTFCMSAVAGGAVTLGWDLLQVSGTEPATIKSVSLAGAQGLRLAGAQVVPVREEYIIGNGWSYPLTPAEVRVLPKGVEWSEAKPAAGYVVHPSAQPGVNLVAGVAATGSGGGSATGLEVTYVAGGTTYQLVTAAGMTVRVAPQHC